MQDPIDPCTRRVLEALHAARTPGWMFPAHFLDIFFEPAGAERGACALMQAGPHCLDATGRVSHAALAVLADVCMAAAVRAHAGREVRIATLTLRLSFGALPAAGRLRAAAHVRMMPAQLAMNSAIVGVEIRDAGGAMVCSGEATFAALENRQQTASHPLPTASTLTGGLRPAALAPDEQPVWEWARTAAIEADGAASFLDRFWSLHSPMPPRSEGGVAWSVGLGRHNSNRVGHLQGGVLLGLLASACRQATAPQFALVDIAVQYLEAASEQQLAVHAHPVRSGGSAAASHASLRGADGKLLACAQAHLARLRS